MFIEILLLQTAFIFYEEFSKNRFTLSKSLTHLTVSIISRIFKFSRIFKMLFTRGHLRIVVKNPLALKFLFYNPVTYAKQSWGYFMLSNVGKYIILNMMKIFYRQKRLNNKVMQYFENFNTVKSDNLARF